MHHLRDALLVPPRLAVGLGIAGGFGVPKLAGFAAFVDAVRADGVPGAPLVAAAVLGVELIGGTCLAVGLCTRIAGGSLFAAMAGIAVTATHTAFPWDLMPFLLGGYLFAVLGGGHWSLDRWRQTRQQALRTGEARS